MKKVYLLIYMLLGSMAAFYAQGQNVEVKTLAELKTAIKDAASDCTIKFHDDFITGGYTDNFAVDFSATADKIAHTYNITIDGDLGNNANIVLKTSGSANIFSLVKTNTAGSIIFKNIKFQGQDFSLTPDSYPTDAIIARGGVSCGSLGSFIFENTHFTGFKGGAIISGGSITVDVKNSTFDYNYTGGTGGALNFEGGAKLLTVDHCSFYKNVSNGYGYKGGAIGLKYGYGLSVTNSVFIDNKTANLGGAIAIYVPQVDANYIIDNCYFKENKSIYTFGVNPAAVAWNDGGAIGYWGNGNGAHFVLSNSTFEENEAEDDGGALILENYGAGATNKIFNNTFYKNIAWTMGISTDPKADAGGGAIQFSRGTPVELYNNTFVLNKASGKNTELKNWGYARGGAIGIHYITDGKTDYPEISMQNNILLGNYVTDESDLKVTDNTNGNFYYSNITSKLYDDTQPETPSYDSGGFTNLGGNIGIDNGIALSPKETLERVFGTNTPELFANATIKPKVGDPKGNATYYQIIPTLPILPGDDTTGDANGLADNFGTTLSPVLSTDQRGYPRDAAKPDAGSTEIFWVRFDANGGSWTKASEYSLINNEFFLRDAGKTTQHYAIIYYQSGTATLTLPTDPDPASGSGATFVEWVLDDGLDTSWQPSDLVANQNTKVKALWTGGSTTYQVIYNGNGAESASVPTNDTGISAGSSYAVKSGTPVRANYTFTGWQASGTPSSPVGTPSLTGNLYAAGDNFTMPGNDVTLLAQWKGNTTPPVIPPKPTPEDPDPIEPTPNPDLAITVRDIAPFCYFEKEFRIPFTLHYTDEELKYTILFSQEAKDAGFTDITEQKVLSGTYITVPVSAAIPAGTYTGTIEIHASEKANIYTSYTFTIHVMEAVHITKQPESVTNKCEGDGLILSVTATGQNLTYQWYLNDQKIEGAIDEIYATVLDHGKEGLYYVEVSGDCGYEISDSVDVKISGLTILMKWDDVMYVSNVDNKYISFQWYHNGEAITTQGTAIYYTNPEGLQGTYFVRANRTDSSYDESCSLTFTEATRSATVSIYPNPVVRYTYLTVESPESGESFIGSKVDMYDMGGRKVYSTIATSQKIQIPVNMALGLYIVHITMDNGKAITQKVVVK